MGFQPTVRQSQPDSPDFVRSYLVGIVNESNTFFSQFIIQGNVNVGKPQYAFILQFLPVAATVRFQEFLCQQGRKAKEAGGNTSSNFTNSPVSVSKFKHCSSRYSRAPPSYFTL